MVKERNPKDSQYMSALFKVCGNLERIGDHAVNICEYTKMIEEKNITFSKEVIGEIAQMREICVKALSKVESIDNGINVAEIAGIEEKIDEMTEQFRKTRSTACRSANVPTKAVSSTPRCSPTLNVSATIS